MAYQPKLVISRQIHFYTIISSISMSTQFNCKRKLLFQAIQFIQTVLIQLNHFSKSTDFVYTKINVKPIDRALSGATIPGQSGPGSNGNEGVPPYSPKLSITGTSPTDCLVSYTGHSLVGGVLPFCRGAVCVFYSPRRLSKQFWIKKLRNQ